MIKTPLDEIEEIASVHHINNELTLTDIYPSIHSFPHSFIKHLIICWTF